ADGAGDREGRASTAMAAPGTAIDAAKSVRVLMDHSLWFEMPCARTPFPRLAQRLRLTTALVSMPPRASARSTRILPSPASAPPTQPRTAAIEPLGGQHCCSSATRRPPGYIFCWGRLACTLREITG